MQFESEIGTIALLTGTRSNMKAAKVKEDAHLHSSILQSKEGTNTAKMKGTKVLVTHIHMCNIIKIHVHCGYIRCMWYIYVASYIPTSRNQ